LLKHKKRHKKLYSSSTIVCVTDTLEMNASTSTVTLSIQQNKNDQLLCTCWSQTCSSRLVSTL